MSGASLGIVTLRRAGPASEDERDAAARNAALVAAFEATGRGLVSSTRLRGRYAIRMCVMNHTTAEEHVRDTLDWFARAPEPGGAPAPRGPSHGVPIRDHVEHSLRPVFAPGELAPMACSRRWTPRSSSVSRAGHASCGWRHGERVTQRWDALRDST